ncbi:hypothetical protein ACFL35_21585 [Candidatus Riflebacteria bacterium]
MRDNSKAHEFFKQGIDILDEKKLRGVNAQDLRARLLLGYGRVNARREKFVQAISQLKKALYLASVPQLKDQIYK